MARTDEQELTIRLEAKIKDFERSMDRAQKKANGSFNKMERDAAQSASKLERSFARAGQGINRGLSGIGRGLATRLAPLAVIGAAGMLGKTFLEKTIAQEKAVKSIEAVIKSTGGVAGVTSKAAQELAASLQKVTTFGDEAILPAEALLLTFTKIGKDVFPDATKIVLDMSEALGQDLKSSAVQVGKALNDPILGVSALRRVGVSFSASQQKVIKDLAETGRVAEAQRLILKELQTEFGGAAVAARDTLGGALKALGNAFGDAFELHGPEVDGLRLKIEDLITTVSDPRFVNAMADIGSSLVNAMENIASAVVTIDGVIQRASIGLDGLGKKLSDFGNSSVFARLADVLGTTDPEKLRSFGITPMQNVQSFNPDARVANAFDVTTGTGIPAASKANRVVEKAADDAAGKVKKMGDAADDASDSLKEQPKLKSAPIETARKYVGLSENRDSDVLENLFKKAGQNVDPKKTAWCAAFVNAVLATNNLPGTGSLAARSFQNYGEKTDKPEKGDIVVLKRGNSQTQGHVGFFEGYDARGGVRVLGGNQSDGVNTKTFNQKDVLSFRSIPGAETGGAAGTNAGELIAERAAAAEKAADAAKQQADAYAGIIAGSKSFTAEQGMERQALGMTAEAAAKLRAEHDLLNQVSAAGIVITPEVRQQISALAGQMAAAEADVQKFATSQEDAQRIAAQWQNIASSSVKGLVSDLVAGKSAAEAFSNVLSNIADKLLDMAVDSLFANAFSGGGKGGGVGGGILGSIGKIFGFASGGHVSGPGTGTSDSIPARLSNGEFVVNARATAKHRAMLEAMNSNRVPAFANGGMVSPSPISTPSFGSSGGGGSAPINISSNVTINASGGTQEQNDDLAKKTSRAVESQMRAIVQQELRQQTRPGGQFSR